jgi:hypothetical protein
MTNSRTNHKCDRCGFPVKSNSDQIRGRRYTESVLLHWPCWIALLAERDQLTAHELMKAARMAEV